MAFSSVPDVGDWSSLRPASHASGDWPVADGADDRGISPVACCLRIWSYAACVCVLSLTALHISRRGNVKVIERWDGALTQAPGPGTVTAFRFP